MYYTEYESPIGCLTLAGEEQKLVGLWLDGQKYFMETLPEAPVRDDGMEIFAQARDWLARYFTGRKPLPQELPLTPIGGGFRQLVWRLLLRIPYGEVTTYGALAKQAAAELGRPSMSAQAVGGAVGHNPISIIIPCHRLVGADGSLTGYAGGIDKKLWLLEHEGVHTEDFLVPSNVGK